MSGGPGVWGDQMSGGTRCLGDQMLMLKHCHVNSASTLYLHHQLSGVYILIQYLTAP